MVEKNSRIEFDDQDTQKMQNEFEFGAVSYASLFLASTTHSAMTLRMENAANVHIQESSCFLYRDIFQQLKFDCGVKHCIILLNIKGTGNEILKAVGHWVTLQ